MEWYEELDYEENPFQDNEDVELIGYEGVIDEVLYRLEAGSMVCVEGKSGAGKTAVLRAALNKFKGTGRLIYLDAQEMSNGLNIENVFKKKAGLMKRMFNKKPKNMVLFLDEVQNLSQKNCERLKYYFDNSFIKSVVFTSSDFSKTNFTTSLRDRISKTIKLREIEEDEAVDIVNSRLGNDEIISEDIIKEVFTKSNKNMKSFLNNCEKLFSFAFEHNGKTVMPEHIKEVFDEEVQELEEKEEVEQVEKNTEEKITKKTVSPNKKPKAKPKKDSSKNKKTAETKQNNDKNPELAVEEPISVSIVDDFKPEKRGVKMNDEEEIDIDKELKKMSKGSNIEIDNELSSEDYEEDYSDFKESDEDDEEELKKVDDEESDYSEKYY